MADLEMATTDVRPADAGAPDEAAEVQALARRGAVGPGPDAARSMRALVILDRTAGRSKMSWRITLEVAALVWRLRRRRGAPRPADPRAGSPAIAPLRATARRHILVTHGSCFSRFGAVGILGVGVNTALLYFLSQAVGLNQLLAAALAAEVAILFNFALNDRWTFRDAPPARSWIRRAVRYNAIALAGLAISLAVFAVLMGELGLYYLGANFVALGAATVWNYTINARFTW